MFVKVRILTKDFYALKVFLPCFIFSASSLSFFTLNESLQNALSLLFPPLFLFCLLRSKRSIEKRRSTHTHTHTLPGRERHGWILDHVLAQGTDRRVVVRFRFSRRRVTRLRPAGEKHVEKRCGADSASERGVCRRRFERWQIVMGGHTRQRGEGEYRTRLANNRGVTTTGIEVFLIYYVILLARKKRILTSPYRVDDSTTNPLIFCSSFSTHQTPAIRQTLSSSSSSSSSRAKMSSSAPASRGVNQQHRAMPFQLFLEKMRQPSAAELVSGIKQFINTFVDDDDDDVDDDDVGRTGKEEREEEKNNETFKKSNRSGNKRDPSKDSDKIQRFLREYAEKFRRHSLWRNCSQEEVEVFHFSKS